MGMMKCRRMQTVDVENYDFLDLNRFYKTAKQLVFYILLGFTLNPKQDRTHYRSFHFLFHYPYIIPIYTL